VCVCMQMIGAYHVHEIEKDNLGVCLHTLERENCAFIDTHHYPQRCTHPRGNKHMPTHTYTSSSLLSVSTTSNLCKLMGN